jgi:2,3-bisphosphoglycerate-dependent phosphoglycerate mutase
MATLTILRHGKSIWNKEKRFTGWTDVALSPRGIAEAKQAGELLKARGVTFDLCFTSYLNRASETLRIVLDTMHLSHVPVQKDWRLNERHYGELQGLAWWEATRKYGAKQVLIWQRHFDVPPPPLDVTDTRFPGNDPLYSHLSPADLPQSESLKDTLARLLPFWHDIALPELRRGKHLLIVAHHNSLRGLLKHLDNISDADISNITIRTADPMLYELNEHIVPIGRENLRPRSTFSQFAQKIVGHWIRGISR